MTPQRAKEIIATYPKGNLERRICKESYFNYGYLMEESEVQEIKKVWFAMPSTAWFAQALNKIARSEASE